MRRSCDAVAGHSHLDAGAVEKTRTSTAFRPQRPQRCASTSSATTARHEIAARPNGRRHWQGRALAKPPKGRNAAAGAAYSVQNGTKVNALFTVEAGKRYVTAMLFLAAASALA